MSRERKDALVVILICNAILISLLELIIPVPIPVPGVKLGLASIITILAITFLDLKDVLLIVCIRCIVVAILSKGITALPFSLTGGILSAVVMWLCYRQLARFMSIKGISIAGAITHNLAQLGIASLILGENVLIFYLPVLMIAAVITGLITGTISGMVIDQLEKKELLTRQVLPVKEVSQ